MKANELRIGNLFNGNTPGDDHVMEITANDILELSDDPLDDYYQHIPITKKWLLDLGFENEKENNFNIGFFSIWKCNDIFLCDKNGIILKTVHQLQNLYFALTGKELKINM